MIDSPQSLPAKFLPNRWDILNGLSNASLWLFYGLALKNGRIMKIGKPLRCLFYVIVVIDGAKPRWHLGMISGGRIQAFQQFCVD
jgi:hypothetical protein